MSLTKAQDLFLQNNLLGIIDGTYTSNNVTVTVKDGRIKCIGTTGDSSEKIPIPIENIELNGKYNFSIQKIIYSALGFPTIFLNNKAYTHLTHIYGTGGVSYAQFDANEDTVINIQLSFAKNLDFDVEFNLMLQESDLRKGYTAYGQTIDKNQNLAEYSDDVVRPRMFGAVGDGEIDDTAALQAAINYALANKKKIILDSGCTYLISKTLVFKGAYIWFDGQNATIKMNDNIATDSSSDGIYKIISAINIDNSPDTSENIPIEDGISLYNRSTYISRVFENLTIDCNIGTANTGLYIINGGKTHYSNIMICDPASYGIQMMKGNEAVFDNIHMTRSRVKDRIVDGENTINLDRKSVGLRLSTSDIYIHDCVAIDFKTGFLSEGSDNNFSRCHVWNAYTKNIIKDSIGFDIINGYATFSQCITDSERYGWVLREQAKVFLTNCCNAYNEQYVDNKESYGEPILFYFDETHTLKGAGLVISSSCFKTKDGLICHFDNLKDSDPHIIIDKLFSDTFTDVHVSEAVRTNEVENVSLLIEK